MRVVKPQSWPVDSARLDWQPNDLPHKWFYVLPDGTGSWGKGLWTGHNTQDRWHLRDNGRVGSEIGALAMRAPDEMLMEYLFIAESSPYAGDAQVTFWLNGEWVGHSAAEEMIVDAAQSVDYVPLWTKLQLYAHANVVPEDTYYDIREFYVSGKR